MILTKRAATALYLPLTKRRADDAPLQVLFSDRLQQYFAILRRRVGFDSVRAHQRKVCLDAFPTPQWPARKLRFWRSIPECGLAGISDIEICGARVRKEVVCYELNLATEWLRRVPQDL